MNRENKCTIFETVATVAAEVKHDSPGDFSSRDELKIIVNKLTEMYEMGARDGVNHDLGKVKAFLKKEIQESKFSDRNKRQYCGTIDSFKDIEELSIWLLSEVS